MAQNNIYDIIYGYKEKSLIFKQLFSRKWVFLSCRLKVKNVVSPSLCVENMEVTSTILSNTLKNTYVQTYILYVYFHPL